MDHDRRHPSGAVEIRAQREAVRRAGTVAVEVQQPKDLMAAAEYMERAYDVFARTMLNLPPYDELIRS